MSGDDFHPVAPTPRNAPWPPASCDRACASAPDSTSPRPASSAAASPHAPCSHALAPDARLPKYQAETFSYPSAVVLPHQPQGLCPFLLLYRVMRPPPRIPMLEPQRSLLPIALSQPLGLTVTHSQQTRCVHHLQLSALHPRHHPDPIQFHRAHCLSPQSWPPCGALD